MVALTSVSSCCSTAMIPSSCSTAWSDIAALLPFGADGEQLGYQYAEPAKQLEEPDHDSDRSGEEDSPVARRGPVGYSCQTTENDAAGDDYVPARRRDF